MSKIAYFQPFSGASGDMMLGALLDAGLEVDLLEAGLRSLGVSGWNLEHRKAMRGPFLATRLRVLLDGAATGDGDSTGPGGHEQSASGRAEPPDDEHHHHHSEDASDHHHHHHHHHPDADADGVADETEHAHAHDHNQEQRNLRTILDLIEQSGLPAPVQDSAARVFRRLGEAEAKVHGMRLEDVHFHEVGAVDSIVDIVGSCLGLHLLNIETIHCAPITVGTGFVHGDHGTMPLPAPATAELLRGVPIVQRDTRAELTTPTGAALLTTLASEFGTMPPMTVDGVGYGAGNDRHGPVPNVLRLFVGEATAAVRGGDRVVVLECCVDDMTPEWIGHLTERLFEADALDVTVRPVLMKKGRPGHEIQAIAPLSAEGRVVQTLFRHGSTFGIRRTETERVVLERTFRSVGTPWGEVRVKIGRLGEETMSIAPEYEDLRAAAKTAGLPLKEIERQVLRKFYEG